MTARLETVYDQFVVPAMGASLPTDLPIPVWAFLCWLTDAKPVVLHGSGSATITQFEPRTPNDRSADAFSKQTAVFAASDGIWALWYAIVDRTRYSMTMLNGALQFEREPGRLTPMHYFFSITDTVLPQQPWRDGTVYVLPQEQFVQQPPYRLGGYVVHEPHWARRTVVQPLAKVQIRPSDFPLLHAVRGHNPVTIAERASRDPDGFPWLDDA